MAELRTVCFTGNVQGVGFRATTADIARHLAVVGYVQNLPDGRVRLVAEGTAPEIDLFLSEIDRRLGHHILSTDSHTSPAGGNYATFEIRY